MSLRKEAQEWADNTAREALKGFYGLVDEAIDLRRAKPQRFALFHLRMLELLKRDGIKRGRRWHALWYRHYDAKAYALNPGLYKRCGLDSAHCPA